MKKEKKDRPPGSPGYSGLSGKSGIAGIAGFSIKKTPLHYCDYRKIILNLQCLHADGIMCAGIAA